MPEIWKETNIKWIPKEGCGLTSTKNYRPISFLNDYKFTLILAERLKIIL